MSRSSTLQRIRQENPSLSSEDVLRAANGDPEVLAKINRRRTWSILQSNFDAGRTNFHAGRVYCQERGQSIILIYLGLILFNIYWLLCMPKPPLTQLFLNWLMGKPHAF